MSVKRFSDTPAGAKRVEFEIDFWKDGQPKPHSFSAYPKIDAFAVARINVLGSNDRSAVEALNLVKNAIRTMLDDNDGTPLDWSPEPLPAEVYASSELAVWPDSADTRQVAIVGGLDDEYEEEPLPQFLAPDGTLHPVTEARKYTEFAAGSSRRRWVELMDGDNDLIVEAKTIMKAWQWLIKEVADRPTVR